ncbi:MAG: orotidine-5'-phosphate decarboxylase [Pseudomonadota bacterium]
MVKGEGRREKGDNPRVIVALDYPEAKPALELAARLDPTYCRLKVGKELFTAAGPDIVHKLLGKGFGVFLDLKFHDIPNTTAAACRAAAELGVWMVNVHASGGRKMMEAAREAVDRCAHRPLLIGVTVLTSMDEAALREIGVGRSPREQVLHLAGLVQQSGLDGVVCSAQEAGDLRARFGPDFTLVTPGIRPPGADAGGQSRIMTPGSAIRAGADYLVIGRPITQASDPVSVLRQINLEVEKELA